MRKRDIGRAAEALDERLKDALGTSIGGTGTAGTPPAPAPRRPTARRPTERHDDTLPGEPDPRTTVP